MQEFNEITAVIFGRLYASFPAPISIRPDAIAHALGFQDLQAQMPSGRTFNEVLHHTVQWLTSEDFIRSGHPLPLERLVLTAKAIAVMNIVPPSLSQPLGSQLADATEQVSTERGKRQVAELMGNFFGSFIGSLTKTIPH
jgi:hypothetical protein